MDVSKTTVTVTSFNGTAINDGTNYTAKLVRGQPLLAGSDPVFVERADDYPVYSGLRLSEREWRLIVQCKAGTVDALKSLFDTSDSTAKKLIVTDSSDSKAWYVYGVPKSIIPRSTKIVEVLLSVADPIWRNNTATTETWTVTSSGSSHSWSVGGNKFAVPVITINPQTVRSGGFTYKRFVTIYNQTSENFADYPINLLGGNLDHAALVTAGKAQADGDDWRVFMDGFEVLDQWPGGGGYNSTTLRTFANISLAPKLELTLGDSIAGAGAVTEIVFQESTANGNALERLQYKANKLLLIGSELYSYETVNRPRWKVEGVTRQAKGSSAASHSVGDTVRWIEHDLWIAYGDSTATAPAAASDNVKPMFSLTSSTNTSWVYTDYYSLGTFRTAQWTPRVNATLWASRYTTETTKTTNYGANHATNTDFSAIASEMGMSIKSPNVAGVWRSESGNVEWRISVPSQITTITTSGEKYRYATSWPSASLEVSNSGAQTWTQIWTEATPSAAQTWEAITGTPTSLSGNYTSARYVFNGTVSGSANNAAHFEVDSITLALNSSGVPSVTLGAETGEYFVDMRVENETTDEYIDVRWIAATGNPITIDCENKTATDYGDANIRGAVSVPSVRKNWLYLAPGTNSIKITETGLADVDITFTYNERSL